FSDTEVARGTSGRRVAPVPRPAPHATRATALKRICHAALLTIPGRGDDAQLDALRLKSRTLFGGQTIVDDQRVDPRPRQRNLTSADAELRAVDKGNDAVGAGSEARRAFDEQRV